MLGVLGSFYLKLHLIPRRTTSAPFGANFFLVVVVSFLQFRLSQYCSVGSTF
jgi:hypothetical protein